VSHWIAAFRKRRYRLNPLSKMPCTANFHRISKHMIFSVRDAVGWLIGKKHMDIEEKYRDKL
jgi:hypothetical protein